MSQTALTQQTAAGILRYIDEAGLTPGMRLSERVLADRLRVSRSPVRNALRLLAGQGAVAAADGGGYTVSCTGGELSALVPHVVVDTAGKEEEVYLALAADRLDGTLPGKVTESALVRRYGVSLAQLARVLARVSAEGWIARLPGYGWEFQDILTSDESHEQSYRFRAVIESGAILDPTFSVDRTTLRRARDRQQALVDGAIWATSDTELYQHNSDFHELVVSCNSNPFFIEALRRVDRMRRLIDYRKALRRDRAIERCREHVAIADHLLTGDPHAAAAAMHDHLVSVGIEKAEPS